MGLRFRKSISIIPGVKLNFGKTGMSVSTGVPGFRKTFHTSGRVTTSVGIPGTGLYYVDTKNTKTQNTRNQNNRRNSQVQQEYYEEPVYNYESMAEEPVAPSYSTAATNDYILSEPIVQDSVAQLDVSSLKSIHKTSDDSIDWTEVLVSPTPPDNTYNQPMWEYYHSMASKVLSGDIDTYLQLIYEVNPLDDLLSYGSGFEFGTDDSKKIEVEFNVNQKALSNSKSKMSSTEYNNLLQDYVCSMCIRIARDMFALLPIFNTIVHATLDGNTVLSVKFDRATLSKVKFGYVDPSDTMAQFKHNMSFNEVDGFSAVEEIR